MSRKDILDTIFKLSIAVIALGMILIYYNKSQINRYKRIEFSNGHCVFDTFTGKSYTYVHSDNPKTQGWVIDTLTEASQIIAYTDSSDGKKPVKLRDDTTGKDQVGRFIFVPDPPAAVPPAPGAAGRYVLEDGPVAGQALQPQTPAPPKTIEKKQEGKGSLIPGLKGGGQ
jgi:hypothetical protein